VEWANQSAVLALELIKSLCLSDGIVKADLCKTVRLEKWSVESFTSVCLSNFGTLSWAMHALGEVSVASEFYTLSGPTVGYKQ
jgi:hypothetical protein